MYSNNQHTSGAIIWIPDITRGPPIFPGKRGKERPSKKHAKIHAIYRMEAHDDTLTDECQWRSEPNPNQAKLIKYHLPLEINSMRSGLCRTHHHNQVWATGPKISKTGMA